MTREEMLKCLAEIRDICASHKSCKDCPLYGDNAVITGYEPETWEIPED